MSKPSSCWLPVHRASPCAWPAKKRETYPALPRGAGDTAAGLESGGRLESRAQKQALQRLLGGGRLVEWLELQLLESDAPGFE